MNFEEIKKRIEGEKFVKENCGIIWRPHTVQRDRIWLAERLDRLEKLTSKLLSELTCYSTGCSVLSEESVAVICNEIAEYHGDITESLTPKPKDTNDSS